MMLNCKNCNSINNIKSGKINNKQRYKCKDCGLHFIEGDKRTNEKVAAKKALCVMLYSLGKGSFRMLAKIFNTHPSLVYKWVIEASKNLPEEKIDNNIMEIEFDEMWHYIKQKKTNYGLLKHLTEKQREQLLGFLEIEVQKHSKNCMIK